MEQPPVRSALAAVIGGLAAVVLAAGPAAAHTGHPLVGFGDGLGHPLAGPDHLLAMVAVGVVAATVRRTRWAAPTAFVGGMLAGGVAGVLGAPLPGVETLVLASVLLLGLTVAGALEGRGRWLYAALAVAGAAHGHAHGAEAPAAANAATYIGGFLTATVALHLIGVAVGSAVRDRRTARLGFGLATAAGGGLLLLGA